MDNPNGLLGPLIKIFVFFGVMLWPISLLGSKLINGSLYSWLFGIFFNWFKETRISWHLSSVNEVFLLMVRWNDFKQILHYESTWPFINTLVTESHWVYENNSSEGHSTQEQKFCDQFSATCPSATHSTLGQSNSPFFIHLSLVKFFWGITFSCEWTLSDE